MPRPRQALLTRDRIVATALALIDADGLAALSTRRLAAALGVQGPSLYNHFATKDAILDAVADSVTATVDTGFFARLDWRAALRRWAWSYREALAAHPNVVPYLAQGPGRRPAALAMADAVYGGLVRAGWPPARATHIGAALRYFVAGSALGSFARGFVEDPELYAAHYPHLTQAHRLAGRQRSVDEGAFALGLDALLHGLAAEYERTVGPLAPLEPIDPSG
ncbi:TetR/AcrR family transcriptional regulator C-terminal domain-containing protein [Micromonospora sp. 4G57]|uniref:TetR/AcrR family transcriptional regulator C-terminal domain-containing protein n=1 Tax=Micromonospora sicca TaxID=2202420 RepID=A0ABU5JCU2_9ACTN|nr:MULTISPECIES: TetR/AcrR family transcriptional regulator C-terminal domain-containing protein [unclassified Micromonospora]MDZ5444474.1 TetR/AcrR family transcriptional regulator C-terminal domain-containing protein [Micromonospora sp. 4G57]MDZ5490358.1 TetR/AcrR family transcriptional regulator C-terminal domain-containing protein [Micromonospora sp. 4G53]